MNKKILVLIITALMFITMIGCGAKNSDGQNTSTQETKLDKIKKAGKLIVGTEATFAPYESVDPKDGKTVIGFDIDLAQAIAKKIGVKLEVKDMKFDGLIPALQAGTIDLIAAGMTVTDERSKNVDFSKIYYTGLQVLVLKQDNNDIKTAADMKGKTIGAQLGTTSEEAAKGIAGVNVKQYDKVDQIMLSVKNGQINGAVVDDTVGVEYVKSLGGLKIVKINELNKDAGGMGLAVQKGNSELLKEVNDTIDELKKNGEFDKLIDKWGLLK